MHRSKLQWLGVLAVLAALVAPTAQAIDWQKFVMPGPLAQPHADLEEDCAQCHASFDSSSEAGLCLVCHEEVAADRNAETGFHGKSPLVGDADCRSCHPEHRGRDFKLVNIDPVAFEHGSTDFELKGAHNGVECGSCHESGKAYREAPSNCIACHLEDDVHDGEFDEDCSTCHNNTAWAGADFDHDETNFPLVGHHSDVECSLCHKPAANGTPQYEETPDRCESCHRLDDAHEGAFGLDCGTCHSPEDWERDSFDHDETGFPLKGAHEKASCESCHVEPPGEVELPEDCGSCHRLDDTHRGSRGTECETCHTSVGWNRTRFDHTRDTDFALDGAHVEATCEGCHPKATDVPIEDTRCIACHETDDAHAGQLVASGFDCAECHMSRAWTRSIRFDHGLTKFPLLGLHAALTCEECHTDARFGDASVDCSSCHSSSDVHEARLGPECADCHNPNGWAVWNFDHDTRTAFELHGNHEGLACVSCHTQPTQGAVSAPRDCEACHHRDDVHRGAFGRDCSTCHSPDDWKGARVGTFAPIQGGGKTK